MSMFFDLLSKELKIRTHEIDDFVLIPISVLCEPFLVWAIWQPLRKCSSHLVQKRRRHPMQ